MIQQKIKTFGQDILTDLKLTRKKKREIRAFRDPRRVAIASQFTLTKEQKEQIDTLFIENYGQKVDYVWHRNYAAHTGQFDYRFLPGSLYIPEFEAFENQDKNFVQACSDKNFIGLIARAVGIRMPRTIVSCTNGVLRDGENRIITPAMAEDLVHQHGESFLKPTVNSSSGKGCRILREEDGARFDRNSIYLSHLDLLGGKNDFTVQELIKCHDSIRTLYAGSVNSFRIISYFWKGKIEIMPIIIRMGRGGKHLDNAHQGGMFCAVNNDGTMGSLAVTEFYDRFSEHPDTHTVFAKHHIDHLDRVIEAAQRMHAAIPQIGVVNWDFTIDADGEPVLIEANCENGSVWLPQMAHGLGAFLERTPEVLQWLRFMKKLRPHERPQYAGGYCE